MTWTPHCFAPNNTTCLSVMARDIKAGDLLDTVNEREVGSRQRGRHIIIQNAITEDGETRIFRADADTLWCRPDKRLKVWRDTRVADARPLDLRDDRPFRNLTDLALAGKAGIAAELPIGSVWEVGPFCKDKDPEVVVITGDPYTSGVNYSAAPEDAYAKGKASWFVKTRTLWSPYGMASLSSGGQPPHVLCALTPRMAAKVGLHNLVPQCVTQFVACEGRPLRCVPACCTPGCKGAISACPIDNVAREVEALAAAVEDWKRAELSQRMRATRLQRTVVEKDRQMAELRAKLDKVRQVLT